MKFRIIIDKEQEEELVARVHQRTPLLDEIEAMVSNVETVKEIVGYDDGDIKILPVKDVESFYIENGKTYAGCVNGKRFVVKKALYELEEILPTHFRKINKSNIANIKHIVQYKTAINGAVDAQFRSGFQDYVSRRCFAELKRRYSL